MTFLVASIEMTLDPPPKSVWLLQMTSEVELADLLVFFSLATERPVSKPLTFYLNHIIMVNRW